MIKGGSWLPAKLGDLEALEPPIAPVFRDERFGFHAAMIPTTAPSLGSRDVNHRIWSWGNVFSFLASILLLGTAARLRSGELRRGNLRPQLHLACRAVAQMK